VNYKDILNDKVVAAGYAEIDRVNNVPFNHGMKHVKNVVNIMDRLTDALGIKGDEKNDLLIASALHDIGQVESRDNHSYKSRLFAEKYLVGGGIPPVRLNRILEAIENHSNKENLDKLPLFANLMAFADKMDFSCDRLDDDWRDKMGNVKMKPIYQDILKVDFAKTPNTFKVLITTDGKISPKDFDRSDGFWVKIPANTKALATKLGLKPQILVDGISLAI